MEWDRREFLMFKKLQRHQILQLCRYTAMLVNIFAKLMEGMGFAMGFCYFCKQKILVTLY